MPTATSPKFRKGQPVEARYAAGDRREVGRILKHHADMAGWYAVRFADGTAGSVHETMLAAL